MRIIEVANKKGTTDNTPPPHYGSWLEYWEQRKGRAVTCHAYRCSGKADVGGHVIKKGEGPKEYILPLCYKHNNQGEDLTYQAWDTDLVAASN